MKTYEALVNVTIGDTAYLVGETFTAEPGLVQAADIREKLVREITAPAPAPVSDKPAKKPRLSRPSFGRKGASK